MSYSGTTAATPNPPQACALPLTRGTSALGHNKTGLWLYSSTNLTTDLTAAGFFSDGVALGMRPGDLVLGTQYTSAGSSVVSFIATVSAVTTAGAASLSTGGTLTSTFS